MKLNIVLLSFIFLVALSCKHDPFVPNTSTPTIVSDTCDSNTIYFLNDVLPILVSNCAVSGCHDPVTAEDGIILNNYDNIIQSDIIEVNNATDSKLFEVLIETDPDDIMPPPPASPLTINQINTIGIWINQGAINNFCNACDSSLFTYSTVIEPIIKNSCTGCHSGPTPNGNLTLVTHGDVQAIALNGALEGVITGASGFEPMPYNAIPLPDCKIIQILKWIDDGAPDN